MVELGPDAPSDVTGPSEGDDAEPSGPSVPLDAVPWTVAQPMRLSALPLTASEAVVIALVDGKRTVRGVIDAAPLPPYATLRFLFRMIGLGVIELRPAARR
jgi:hypothetical protein